MLLEGTSKTLQAIKTSGFKRQYGVSRRVAVSRYARLSNTPTLDNGTKSPQINGASKQLYLTCKFHLKGYLSDFTKNRP
jgi:hypothetical protein